jgi:hypothetical protein
LKRYRAIGHQHDNSNAALDAAWLCAGGDWKIWMGTNRYFFNIITSSGAVSDIEGSELPSLEQARAEAVADARVLMSDAIRSGIDISGRSMEICDDAGQRLLIVPFREAILHTEE